MKSTIFTSIDLKENNYMIETFENGILTEAAQENKDYIFKNRCLDAKTLKMFRNMGGKESIKQGKKFGIGCTISTSISPDRNTKVVRYFFY
jgi:hypothetical protein